MDPHGAPFSILALTAPCPAVEPHTPALVDAACRGLPPDLFFPAQGNAAGARRAKAVCATCPVRAECLDLAIANHERFGVWGGMTEHERRAEAARRTSTQRTTA